MHNSFIENCNIILNIIIIHKSPYDLKCYYNLKYSVHHCGSCNNRCSQISGLMSQCEERKQAKKVCVGDCAVWGNKCLKNTSIIREQWQSPSLLNSTFYTRWAFLLPAVAYTSSRQGKGSSKANENKERAGTILLLSLWWWKQKKVDHKHEQMRQGS